MAKKEFTQEERVARAKNIVADWNAFKSLYKNEYLMLYLRKEAKEQKLSYVNPMLPRLVKNGLLIRNSDGYYVFNKDRPIHYSIVLECMDYQRKVDAERKKRRVEEKAKANEEKAREAYKAHLKSKNVMLVDNEVIPILTEAVAYDVLGPFSAQTLVDELRRRGYTVKATKTEDL